MKVYIACLLLLLVLAITAVAWIRRPGTGAAKADTEPPAVGTDAHVPAEAAAPPPTVAAKQANVSIDNFKFRPEELTVAVGTTVTWTNHDDVPHTATSKDDPAAFDSKALDTDGNYSFTFTKPGTYRYYCKVHTHMTASVVVK